MNLEDTGIYGGIFTEGDGHIDPSSVTNAFADRAKGGSMMQELNEWTVFPVKVDEIGCSSMEIIETICNV